VPFTIVLSKDQMPPTVRRLDEKSLAQARSRLGCLASLPKNETIVLISKISTIVNGTLLKFGKRYEDDLMVIFDQWQNLHLGLDALSNQKILNGI
jgi:hypothetical protein